MEDLSQRNMGLQPTQPQRPGPEEEEEKEKRQEDTPSGELQGEITGKLLRPKLLIRPSFRQIDEFCIVRVKTMDERETRIAVRLSEKVVDLKSKIFEKLDIPVDRQRLIFLGKQLKDDLTLDECKVKDDVCILLVANRAQNRSEPPRRAQEGSEANGGDFDFSNFILNALNETAQMRRNRRLLFQQNARSFLRNLRLNANQSRETINQN